MYIRKRAPLISTKKPCACLQKSPVYIRKRALHISAKEPCISPQKSPEHIRKRVLYMSVNEPYISPQKSPIHIFKRSLHIILPCRNRTAVPFPSTCFPPPGLLFFFFWSTLDGGIPVIVGKKWCIYGAFIAFIVQHARKKRTGRQGGSATKESCCTRPPTIESRHTYIWVMAHMYRGHAPRSKMASDSIWSLPRGACTNESRHKWTWVWTHIYRGRVPRSKIASDSIWSLPGKKTCPSACTNSHPPSSSTAVSTCVQASACMWVSGPCYMCEVVGCVTHMRLWSHVTM